MNGVNLWFETIFDGYREALGSGVRGITRTESEEVLLLALVAGGNENAERGGGGDAEFCREGRIEGSDDDLEDPPRMGLNKTEDDGPSGMSRAFLPNIRALPLARLWLLDG